MSEVENHPIKGDILIKGSSTESSTWHKLNNW